jgi:hypothetical protein
MQSLDFGFKGLKKQKSDCKDALKAIWLNDRKTHQ